MTRLRYIVTALLAVAFLAAPAPAQADPVQRCRDPLARLLIDGGFTGHTTRVAWAVVMRESRGQNLVPGHPMFNGSDWGVWQINSGAHGGNRWFTQTAMSNPAKQTRIAYRHLSQRGKYWRPWGLHLSRDGRVTLDTTHYGSWSAWQHQNWIWQPFIHFYGAFPRDCR